MVVAVGQCLSWNTLPPGNRGPNHVNVPHEAAPSTSSGTGWLNKLREPEADPFDKLRDRRA